MKWSVSPTDAITKGSVSPCLSSSEEYSVNLRRQRVANLTGKFRLLQSPRSNRFQRAHPTIHQSHLRGPVLSRDVLRSMSIFDLAL